MYPTETTYITTSEENEFEEIKLSWSNGFKVGLTKNGLYSFFFYCQRGESAWLFPIGAKGYHESPNTMPLIMTPAYNGKEVQLWMRIQPNNGFDGFGCSIKIVREYYSLVYLFISIAIDLKI